MRILKWLKKLFSLALSLIKIPKLVAVLLILFYQKCISPFKRPSCIYYPTCSVYALHAIRFYGLVKGGYLGLKRLLRCHPWHRGGVDTVPFRSSYDK